jgi:electron transfer flavoprotein alpha subunit
MGGFEAVIELAKVLGAAIGGTRPTADKGWIPQESMIGQSGKTVSPELFISIGASGAMHFTTGFLRSKVILAVDQNPKAPIFEVADIGIVGDLSDILPLLTEEFLTCKEVI